MKKQIFVTAALALLINLCSVDVTAQNKTWSLGAEIGANFSKVGNDGSNSELKPGILGGLFLTYSIENTHAFTGKILYSQKGYKFADTKTNLNYIEVPIIGRFFLNREGKFRPNVFVGPSLGFLTGSSTQIGSGDRVKNANYDLIYNTFDFGITGGLGLNFVIANETRFLLDFRYTHGLSDITKDNSTINNQAIGITAGFSFGI